jgi:hypothetical protein
VFSSQLALQLSYSPSLQYLTPQDCLLTLIIFSVTIRKLCHSIQNSFLSFSSIATSFVLCLCCKSIWF